MWRPGKVPGAFKKDQWKWKRLTNEFKRGHIKQKLKEINHYNWLALKKNLVPMSTFTGVYFVCAMELLIIQIIGIRSWLYEPQFHQCFHPKCVKMTAKLSIFFVLLWSACVKAAHRMLMKLTPVILYRRGSLKGSRAVVPNRGAAAH